MLLLPFASAGASIVTNAFESGAGAEQRTFGLGDDLTVQVHDLGTLALQAKTQGKSLILYLNSIPLKGLKPEAVDTNTGVVRVHLERSSDKKTRDAWAMLLGRPSSLKREVTVSVGLEDQTPVETTAPLCQLIVIRPWRALVLCLVFVVVFLWFRRQARCTNMLRDPGPDPGTGRLRPFSLARVQMAGWFFLTTGAFLLIYAVSGGMDAIPNSALALIGISAGTGLAVQLQDASKPTTEQQRTQLEAERKSLESQSARDLQGEARLAEVKRLLAALPPSAFSPATQGWLNDILTDAQGYSFHRFQMATWTLILGVVFLIEVWRHLAMPEFDGTLLALMGISSGTYLGFMIPEKHSSQQSLPG